jgi:hypothetical protein
MDILGLSTWSEHKVVVTCVEVVATDMAAVCKCCDICAIRQLNLDWLEVSGHFTSGSLRKLIIFTKVAYDKHGHMI